MKDLNLIPKSYYLKKKEKKKRIIRALLTFAAMIIVLLAFAFPYVLKYDLNKKIATLKSLQVENSTGSDLGVRSQLSEIGRLSKERQKEATKIDELLKGATLSMILEKIEASKPDKLFLINTPN